MPTQLSLYNGALRLCKTRKLSAVTDNTESRRLLDAAWDNGGGWKFCLELGQWTFATRSAQVDYDPSVTPGFGFLYAFSKPTDYVRTVALCTDEYFQVPLTRYTDEANYWYSDLQTLYIKWISTGDAYGGDLTKWTEQFGKLVEAYLANEIVGNLTQNSNVIARVEKNFAMAKVEARSLDAMNKPTVFLPQGSWAQARRGTQLNYRNIENSNNQGL